MDAGFQLPTVNREPPARARFVTKLRTAALTFVVLLGGALVTACREAEAPEGARPTATGPSAAAPALAFAAGGSIYALSASGEVRTLLAGDRAENWLASPSFSPDGQRLAYTCGFDICVADADGRDARVLAQVAELSTPPGGGADNWSLGAQSVAWSPDGEWIAYTLARVGGVGIVDLWVMRADGSDRRKLYEGGTLLYRPAWFGADRIAVAERDMLTYYRRAGGSEETLALPAEAAAVPAQTAIPGPDGRWLVGAVADESAILYGTGAGMRPIATGVSPALSPDGRRAAYFRDDAVYVVPTSGGEEEKLADAAPLGGRDRFFGERPECDADAPACSYRYPSLAWNPAGYDPGAFEPTPGHTATVPAGALPVAGLFDDPRPSAPDETVAHASGQNPPVRPPDRTDNRSRRHGVGDV